MNCLICLMAIQKKSKFPDYHDACFRRLIGTTKISPVLPFTRKEFFEDRARKSSKRVGLSGVQPKLGLKVMDDVLETTNTHFTHIIKPSPESWPQLAEDEHLTMLISKLLGIETADCGLIRFADDELVYITKRFDISADHKRIHQEDMMQAMGIHVDLENNAKYRAKSYEEVGLFLSRQSSIAISARLFERVFFNFMISNDDYHLKNISIKFDPASPGGIALTPHYDSVNTGIYGPQSSEMACDLISDNNGFSKAHDIYGFHSQECFEELARRLGLPSAMTHKFYKRYLDSWPQIESMIERSHLSPERKIAYKKELTSRREKFFLEKVKR